MIANGGPLQLPDGSTLADLLTHLGLEARWVVAEHNGRAVERAEVATAKLADGDRVELVRAVAGG